MNVLDIKDLHFRYDEDEVLKGIDLSLEQGTYTSVLGPNGSGKSTLAKLITGLLEKEKGSIQIFGEELTEKNVYALRNRIGIVFQNPDNQFIGSTVRDDIAFGLENHRVEHEKMDPIIEEFAEKVSMTPFLDMEPAKLSGGQKQRVAIAGVLAMSPEILIFDESTSMLDPEGKAEINALIRTIHKEKNMTIISITHDIEEASYGDRVIVLDDGRIVMDGSPKKVLTDEKQLAKHRLELPFSVRMRNELAKNGVKVSTSLTMEELAEELWRLHSGK
ncbi:MAG: energy-coupling factor transporter ATPase [Erysipelotrichales bacterium]|nr:energy-coupling factor transporter ATPase [Erysipelotrichales bacterium]